jgi:hypothetical protein
MDINQRARTWQIPHTRHPTEFPIGKQGNFFANQRGPSGALTVISLSFEPFRGIEKNASLA